MAAAGFTPISLYYTTTSGAGGIPSAGNLVNGELAINITDGKLYYKDNGGTVQVIATKATGTIGGSTTQVQYNNAGVLAGSSNLTFDGTSLTLGGNPTLSAGTANGVLYLNGSKVATSGSALVFDGTNLGLGVTPSAWGIGKALQVNNASLMGYLNRLYANANTYFDGTGTGKYIASDYATSYQQVNGIHQWFNAPSGTAGNAITFTQAMTLDASGVLYLGATGSGQGSRLNLVKTTNSTIETLAWLQNDGTGFKGAEIAFGEYTAKKGYVRNQYISPGVWCTDIGSDEVVRFFTGTYSGTERARITSGGDFLVKGAGTAGSTDAFQVSGSAPADAARITSGGNFKIGGTADRGTTEGDKQLVLFNGTAPVGTLTNGISLYSSSGEAYVMDAAGNATLFSPHDRDTNEWIFRSKHTPSGKVLKIDVERLLRFVNDHFGLDAVQEFIEP